MKGREKYNTVNIYYRDNTEETVYLESDFTNLECKAFLAEMKNDKSPTGKILFFIDRTGDPRFFNLKYIKSFEITYTNLTAEIDKKEAPQPKAAE